MQPRQKSWETVVFCASMVVTPLRHYKWTCKSIVFLAKTLKSASLLISRALVDG